MKAWVLPVTHGADVAIVAAGPQGRVPPSSARQGIASDRVRDDCCLAVILYCPSSTTVMLLHLLIWLLCSLLIHLLWLLVGLG